MINESAITFITNDCNFDVGVSIFHVMGKTHLFQLPYIQATPGDSV